MFSGMNGQLLFARSTVSECVLEVVLEIDGLRFCERPTL